MPNPLERTILVTGTTGQVGFELLRSLQGLGRVVAADRRTLDLADFDQVRRVVRDVKPQLIINPAAYTAVDRAESDADAAMRINGEAPGILAEEAKRVGAVLFHYSTDYVFDGSKEGFYLEDDSTSPLSVYGASKLAGERAIAQVGAMHMVFRTSWVYAARGQNFLRTMLRLAEQRPELQIVADQIGAPTWSNTLATMTAHVAALGLLRYANDNQWWAEKSGIYHLTTSGHTSWAGFAEAIFELATLAVRPKVNPIGTEQYPTPARRPKNSRLSNEKFLATFGIAPPDWREALALCLTAS
ncbi:dTDP-4-dehydrorhamnose reductase [Trinickia fusca]|uniref:dTDP-4-dehydrorhamnose reductase n=1 Tax=Trinickia fusca TaxID=2419777 RepID=A0A494XJG9_9BURK|nr:dTDP-4-dehydrorhamnose reductase [Trinickia fusca]RKP50865.1 dTDP-4-dehydrorhamnose reductase [Trinickia fusca]